MRTAIEGDLGVGSDGLGGLRVVIARRLSSHGLEGGLSISETWSGVFEMVVWERRTL